VGYNCAEKDTGYKIAKPMIINAIGWICVYAQEIAIEFEGGPVEFSDLASLLPIHGPFMKRNPHGGESPINDRFMTEAFSDFDRKFMSQIIPMVGALRNGDSHPCENIVNRFCAGSPSPLHCLGMRADRLPRSCVREIENTIPFRCAEDINASCEDGKPIFPCLERLGRSLSPGCHDAVIVTHQALAGLKEARRNAVQPKPPSPMPASERKKHPIADCPDHFTAHGTTPCCTAFWKMDCGQPCAMAACEEKGWEWQWRDFRHNPYKCCPAVKRDWIGGNPICPMGWEHDAVESCCWKHWEWDCQLHCAEHQCTRQGDGWNWIPTNIRKEPYKCCLGPHVAGPHVVQDEVLMGKEGGSRKESEDEIRHEREALGIHLREHQPVARDQQRGKHAHHEPVPKSDIEVEIVEDKQETKNADDLWPANQTLSVVVVIMIVAFLCVKRMRDHKGEDRSRAKQW